MSNYLLFVRQNLALLTFGFITVFTGNLGQSFFIAWFGAGIQESLNLSAGAYGSAYSLATLCSAVTVMWAGGLIDKMPLRRYVILISVGLVVALAVLSQTQSLPALLLGFFLLRLFGQSLLPHTGSTTMSRYFEQGRGKGLSLASSGMPIGEIVLPVIAVASIAWVGWQYTYLGLSLVVLLCMLPLFLWLLRISPRVDESLDPGKDLSRSSDNSKDNKPAGRRAVLSDYRFWLAFPGLIAGPFLLTGLFIHQNFLLSEKGWSMNWLATCFIIYGAVHWGSSLISGALVDRLRAPRMLPWILVPLLACMLTAAFVPGQWSAPLMMALLGVAAGAMPPVTGSLWPEIYGTARLGAIRAMNLSIMVLSTAMSPVLFGYFIDRSASGEQLYAACSVFVAVALVMMCLSYPANSRPVATS